ncbi:MAG TPA: FkbM family methyltransferase [Chlamydiales bacterium]|nr:FkbM family methyltransferase [Chlamydiales bacterium]
MNRIKEKNIPILSILLSLLILPLLTSSVRPPKPDAKYEKYAKKPLLLIAEFLPVNPVILEAGAHYGNDTLKFKQMWPEAKILCFEPNPHAFTELSAKTEGIRNIHRYPIALNNYNGFATLYLCYGSNGDEPIYEGASSLLEPSERMQIHYQGPKIEVPCVVLDDWCKEHQIEQIDFMWLDLEGLEIQVLQSSPKILEKVKVIYTETNFEKFRVGTTLYKHLADFLQTQGFTLLVHWYVENSIKQGNAIFVKKPEVSFLRYLDSILFR